MSIGRGALSQSMSTCAGLAASNTTGRLVPACGHFLLCAKNVPCPENAGIPGASIA